MTQHPVLENVLCRLSLELPYPAVGLGPDVAHLVSQRVQQVGAGRVQVRAGPVDRQPHALEQVPVASPLRLPDGAVASPGGAGVAVAAQAQLGFLVRNVPAQPVERVYLGRGGGNAAEHPGQRALDFLGQAEPDEGIEHERGIADPPVPVVVVAVAADSLRQRRGGGGRHGAGGGEGEELEREYAAQDQVTVVALVGHRLAPPAPGFLAGLPAAPDFRGRWHHQRRLAGRDEGEQRMFAGPRDELPAELARAHFRLACRSVTSTSIRSATCRIGASLSLAHGRARWNSVPAATRHRIGTSPRSGLMSRASSAQGSGPFVPWLSESMTRTAPSRVLNVVSSTLVPGR